MGSQIGRERAGGNRQGQRNESRSDRARPVDANYERAGSRPLLRQMLPPIPIILGTLYANKFLEQEAFSAGVTAVVSKDATVKTLVNQAQDLLRAA